jgi:hypothetical protein
VIPDWILLPPIFFPFFGALIFAFVAPRLPARARTGLPILFLIIELVLILVNIAPGTHRFAFAGWTPAAFNLALQLDGVTQLLVLTMTVPLVALWLIAPPRKPFDLLPIAVFSSAILLAAANNLLTVYLAASLLDLSIFVWRLVRDIERESAVRSLIVGQLSGLMFLAGILLLAAGQTAPGATLIALGLWARTSLYPFHYLLPTRGADAFDLWFARGIPLIAAANVWLHWSAWRVETPFTLIGILAIGVLIVAAFTLWREESPMRIANTGITQVIAFVPLAIAFGGNAVVALALWLTVSFAMASALFEIALRWRAENLNRWSRLIWFLGLFTLAGLPLTPAFLGRVGAYVALWQSNNGVVILLAGAVMLAILMPVWNIGFALKGSEPRNPSRIEYAGLSIVLIYFAVLVFVPMPLAQILGTAVGQSAERALDLVIRTDNVIGVVLSVIALFAPVFIAYGMNPLVLRLRPRTDSAYTIIARWIGLDWLAHLANAIMERTGRLARGLVSITEENPTVWLLFAALWVAIFAMLIR